MSYNRKLTTFVKEKDQLLGGRDEAARLEPGTRRRPVYLVCAIVLIALTLGSIFGDRGLITLAQKRHQVEELRSEIGTLREDNARLASEVAALRTSPRAVERLAREQLGLARPDEVVFLLRRTDAAGRP
jgi:cell division protein FtsB